MREFREVWRFREVLLNLVRRNLKVRYKNSILGFFWSLLNPLVQIGVWWFVFKIIMKNNEPNYMAKLICGFLPWLFFSQTVLDSTACVTQEMALVKKAYFPRTILPLSALFSNLIHLALAFIVLLALYAAWQIDFNIYWLWVLPCIVLIAVFAYGLSAMLAAWSVFYADVKFIVGNLLALWFFLTPVLYSITGFLATEGVARTNWLTVFIDDQLPKIKMIYLADPVAIGILGFRSALLYGGQNPLLAPEHPELVAAYPFVSYIIAACAIALVTAIVGHIVFQRLAHQFAERG